MNVGSITTNNSIGYEYRKTQKAVSAQSFTDSMKNVSGAMIVHGSNNEDGIAIGSSTDRSGSVAVYKPNDFDPANPVYKVKAWDAGGNVTEERMVDISKVDPNSSDYLDMFAYSSHLTDSGECPGAQEAFMKASFNQHGAGTVYNSYTDDMDWIGILKYAMQQQYDLGNLAGYAKYKQFWDFLEQ